MDEGEQRAMEAQESPLEGMSEKFCCNMCYLIEAVLKFTLSHSFRMRVGAISGYDR